MKYFEPTEVSSSWRPILQPNESLIAQQGSVGLYERKDKLDDYQDGTCYLTSHRLIYVDNIKPRGRAVQITLNLVKDIESYGGFLRSSPKLIIYLAEPPARQQARSSVNSPVNSTWVCPICSFSNQGSHDVCSLCGVKRTNQSTTANNITPEPTAAPAIENATEQGDDGLACRVCTFLNHPSMIQCEMCGSDLPRSLSPSISTQSSVSLGNLRLEEDAHIRIAFRAGGQSSFLAKLKGALEAKAWDKSIDTSIVNASKSKSSPLLRGVGISAIQDRIEKNTMEANETMSDAFQDLDRLMAKATEMVKLAESISVKMNKEETNNSDGDMSKLRTYLMNLGISDPVTRGSAGSIYHQELARELAEFLDRFLDKQDGMKSLTDLYCVFNRARGVALISPEDLYKASQQFEALQLPFRLRRFPSGLLVVQSLDMDDDRAAKRILQHVQNRGGTITALQLAEVENLALALAQEQLMVAEQKGLVCRDEGPTGLTFYENRFLLQ